MDYYQFDRITSALLAQRWVFAKTMPQNPHWYTLRKAWNHEDVSFDECVVFLRQYGYKEQYQRRWYTVFDINDMKYWTMGAPLGQTILINRAYQNKDGERVSEYDRIAEAYDSLFASPADVALTQEIATMLPEGNQVLDIGCGTGMFLDYRSLPPATYTGIDVSSKMLAQFKYRRPAYQTRVIQSTFERFSGGQFDVIISLFGAPNYVLPDAIRRIPSLLRPDGKFFLMYYKPEYEPVTYARSGVTCSHFQTELVLSASVHEWHDFLLVTNYDL